MRSDVFIIGSLKSDCIGNTGLMIQKIAYVLLNRPGLYKNRNGKMTCKFDSGHCVRHSCFYDKGICLEAFLRYDDVVNDVMNANIKSSTS